MGATVLIIVDKDQTICDLLSPWLDAYNDGILRPQALSHGWGDPYYKAKIRNIKKYDFRDSGIDRERLFGLLTPEIFEQAKPLPGAIAALKELSKNHKVAIVTSPPNGDPSSPCVKASLEWTKKHFPFVESVEVVNDKSLIRGDLIIDDKPSTMQAWIDQGRMAASIDWPWSGGVTGSVLVPHWKDTKVAWSCLLGLVTALGAANQKIVQYSYRAFAASYVKVCGD